MGEVYEAFDETTSRSVALKCLPRLAPESLLLFKREFRTIADTVHPNLVRLGELACDEGVWFFTMELVRGEDFVSFARRRGLDALRSCLRQLAGALDSLHRAGHIHRDIKPHNVLVEPSGRVVVLDFGLVLDTQSSDGTQSATQSIRGTPMYMAPEQATGGRVGPACDFYAVGAMLYEALVGRPPIEGTPLVILVEKLRRDPTPPSHAAADVPPDLDALCTHLLQPKPEARAGVAELLALQEPMQAGRTSDPAPRYAASAQVPFVGRRAELGLLRSAFAASASAAVGVVIEGESGVGKSALARCFATEARNSGALVLFGRCFDRENVPYKVLDGVIDSLARQLARRPKAEVDAFLPRRRDTSALLETFPVLRAVESFDAVPRPSTELDAAEHRRALFSALRDLIERIGLVRRVVIVVDDLQWADTDSHIALSELLTLFEAPPALWVFTSRPTRDSAETTSPAISRLSLRPLDVDDATTLAMSLGCAESDAKAVARESHGHPLFLREMSLRSEALEAPASLDDAIARRVSELDGATRSLVEVIALGGCPLPTSIAARAAGIDPSEADRAIALARSQYFLRSSDGDDTASIEAYHDRVRETVVSRLVPERMAAHHVALAEALEGSYLAARRPDVHAIHLRAAGRMHDAMLALARAGRAASRATAFDAASACFREAIALGSGDATAHADLHEELGDALLNAGRPVDAAGEFLRASDAGDAEHALRRRRKAGLALLDSGDGIGARRILAPILESSGESWPIPSAWFLIRLVLEVVLVPLHRWRADKLTFASSSAHDALTADLMVDISMRLATTDHMLAGWFGHRALRIAIRSGDAVVVCRAVSYFRGVAAALGRPDLGWDTIAARAESIVGETDTTQAFRLHGAHMAHFFRGEVLAAVDAGLRLQDVVRRIPTRRLACESLMVEMTMCWARFWTGRLDHAPSVRAAAREAIRRRDPIAVMYLAEQAHVAWLVNFDLDGFRRSLDIAAELMPVGPLNIRDNIRTTAELQLKFFTESSNLDKQYAALTRQYGSPLVWTESSRMSAPRVASLGLLVAMHRGEPVGRWRRATWLLGRLNRKNRNPMTRATSIDNRVAHFLCIGNRARALEEMRSAVDNVRDHGLDGMSQIYSHRVGRFIGGSEGTRLMGEAEAFFRDAGAKDARFLCMIWSPLPEDDFTQFQPKQRTSAVAAETLESMELDATEAIQLQP